MKFFTALTVDDEIAISCTGELRQGYTGCFVIAALEHLNRDEVEIIVGEGRISAFVSPVGDDKTVMMVGVVRMAGTSCVDVSKGQAA
ncbi:hypothetical protein [Rhizobium sp. 007]|uniref:hypothetical protein n=1 Tax=Rhizobium sp. 007 TaxID=2785056 RepID=UPI00188E9464|nr:hypothetical protein [Rhizobium sp. 007]QPB19301.1 hypothetical protein ISN39_17265 [Rhizobium sp. 007]